MPRRASLLLSASTLALLLECPRCFWLHMKQNLRRPSGPFPSLPGGIDGALKRYFDRYRAHGTLPPGISDLLPGRLFADAGKLKKWQNNRIGIRTKRPDLGIELMGALDDLLEDGDTVMPLDFKTRGYALKANTHHHYQHQLDLYAYLLERNGYRTSGKGYLLFFWPEAVNDGGIISFHTEAVEMKTDNERAEALLAQAARVLKDPLPSPHDACAFCAFTHDYRSFTEQPRS